MNFNDPLEFKEHELKYIYGVLIIMTDAQIKQCSILGSSIRERVMNSLADYLRHDNRIVGEP